MTKNGLMEIDSEITARCNKLEQKESGIFMIIQIGRGYGMVDLARLDGDVDEECDYCGAEVADVEHLIWQCCFFKETRQAVDEQIAKLDMKLIMPAIRRGIAPAMRCDPKCTYWGETETLYADELKAVLGIEGDLQGFEEEEIEVRGN